MELLSVDETAGGKVEGGKMQRLFVLVCHHPHPLICASTTTFIRLYPHTPSNS